MEVQTTDRESSRGISRFFRFSLKTLLLIVLLTATFAAGWRIGLHQGSKATADELGKVWQVILSEQNK